VRVAKALGELPHIDAAFAAGELSYCKVRAMTRVANPAIEERLLEMARHATGAQLEQICRGFRRVQRAAALDDEARRRAAEPDRYLRQRTMPDGMVRIEMQLLPDEAELVWQALEQVRAELVADVKGAAGWVLSAERPAVVEPSPAADLDATAPEPCCERRSGTDIAESAEGIDSAESVESNPRCPDLSAESCPVAGDTSADPLAHLFAPEQEAPGPRGTWARCEQTGELVYYGSDPPEAWPEEYGPTEEEQEADALDRARARLPSRSEWAARRAEEMLPGRVDALVTLAVRTLNGPQGSEERPRARAFGRRRQRPLLLVHLSEDRLAQALAATPPTAAPPTAAPPAIAPLAAISLAATPLATPVPFVAELHGGSWLRGETLLRLACDAGVAVVRTDERGSVLDVGRRRRTIPPAILRALLVRDGHCQFPGCCGDGDIEAHHIDHWTQGGETRLDNLLILCPFHHKAVHEGGCTVCRVACGSHVFRDPFRRILEQAPLAATAELRRAGEPASVTLAAEHEGRGLVIDRTTSLPRWDGTTPDIGAAVSGLWWRQERYLG
jgi:hypothetical protein